MTTSIHDCAQGLCAHEKVSEACVCLTRVLETLGDVALLRGDGDNAAMIADVFCVPDSYAGLVRGAGLLNNTVPDFQFRNTCVSLFQVVYEKIVKALGTSVLDFRLMLLAESSANPMIEQAADGMQDILNDEKSASVLASVALALAVRQREHGLEFISYVLRTFSTLQVQWDSRSDDKAALARAIRTKVTNSSVWMRKVAVFAPRVFRSDQTLTWYAENADRWHRQNRHLSVRGSFARKYVDFYVKGGLEEEFYLEWMGHTEACACGVSWCRVELEDSAAAAAGGGGTSHMTCFCCLANCMTVNSGCRIISRITTAH